MGRGCDPVFRTVHQHKEGWRGYESQSLSLWIDVVAEEDEGKTLDIVMGFTRPVL